MIGVVGWIDVLEGLSLLASNSIDIALIDPPYNIGKDFGNNFDKLDMVEYVEWSKKWLNESIRVLKPSGTIFIYGFSEILAHISVHMPIEHRWLIWHYTNKNTPLSSFWQRSHEAIIMGWKDNKERIFNLDDVREPYTETYLDNIAGKTRKATIGRFSRGDKTTEYKAHEKGALPRDVIKVPALAGRAGTKERHFLCKTCDLVCLPTDKAHESHETIKHPTQKPYELTKKLILSAQPQTTEKSILVPFAGSGAELKVAKDMNFTTFIGFDINSDFVKLGNGLLDIKDQTRSVCDGQTIA